VKFATEENLVHKYLDDLLLIFKVIFLEVPWCKSITAAYCTVSTITDILKRVCDHYAFLFIYLFNESLTAGGS